MQYSSHYDNNDLPSSSETLLNMRPYSASTITASDLLLLNPSKHGFIHKKSNNILSYMFPCFFPRYNERYLVLIGGYLYRFKSLHDDSIKGVPIPLDGIITIAVNNKIDNFSFEIRMIRKNYTFMVDSLSEVNEWVSAIKERQQLSIRERMGHIPVRPEIVQINKKAEKLFEKKLKDDTRIGDTINNPLRDPMLS